VTAVLGSKRPKGKLLETTDGTTVNCELGAFSFKTKESDEQRIVLPPDTAMGRATNFRLGLIINDSKATFQFGADQVGHELAKPAAGQLILHGGETGHAFGHLTIAGKVNPDWAAAFFAE
jgi:hypothetical protein